MLEIRALRVTRGGRTVLDDIDLCVPARSVVGVLGPNGAGKSTLLGIVSGELQPTGGEVLFEGRALASWGGQERARRLAVLPQQSSLDFAFTVRDVVSMGRLPHATGETHDAQIVDAALSNADAVHLEQRNYLTLSGGERQRVHLARVMAQVWTGSEGQTLLLDEPTSALDPLHQHTVLQAVRDFADRGGAVLVVLHDLNLAARYCDRLVLLDAGRPFANGSPSHVLLPESLERVFGLEVLVTTHPERGHPLIIAR